MPKNRQTPKTGCHKINPSTKYRIGPRKSGRSALNMSTTELLVIAMTSKRGRDRDNAATVLRLRHPYEGLHD